jgi:hypothetical protein
MAGAGERQIVGSEQLAAPLMRSKKLPCALRSNWSPSYRPPGRNVSSSARSGEQRARLIFPAEILVCT